MTDFLGEAQITSWGDKLGLPLAILGALMGSTKDIAAQHGPGKKYPDPYTWALRTSDAIQRFTGTQVDIAGSKSGLTAPPTINLGKAIVPAIVLFGLKVYSDLKGPFSGPIEAWGVPLAAGYMIGSVFDTPEPNGGSKSTSYQSNQSGKRWYEQ